MVDSIQKCVEPAVIREDLGAVIIGKDINDVCNEVNDSITRQDVRSTDAFAINRQKSLKMEDLIAGKYIGH